MGRLIHFEDHHPALARNMERRRREQHSGLIPLQLALDETDIEKCFAQVVRYGRCAVIPRANPSDAGKILFLIQISDALDINRQLLELEDDDSPAVARRIDHIQLLENSQHSLLGRVWDHLGVDAVPLTSSLAPGEVVPMPSR